MNSDPVRDDRQVAGGPPSSHVIAAHSQRQMDRQREQETGDCHRACDNYDMAHAEYLESFGTASLKRGNRNAAGAAALAALAIAAMTATLFWVAGLLIAAVCGALAVREQLLLNEASERCQTAIQKMYVEYRAARRECGNSDCMPARPSQTCG